MLRNRLAVLADAAVVLWILARATGCAATQPQPEVSTAAGSASDSSSGVPEWAMTAKAQTVDAQMSLASAKEQAVSELQLADLPQRHLPAEQLANAALQNLEAGNLADAAVWLSLASYRYTQEWNRILRAGEVAGANPGSLPWIFGELRNRELNVYGHFDFGPQLNALGQVMRGEDMVSWGLQERLAEMFRDGREDVEASAEVVRGKLAARGEVPQKLLTAGDLAAAYLQHLRASAEHKRDLVYAVGALADTPLAAFSLEALRWGYDVVNPGPCRRVANQLSTHRKEVVAFLAYPKSVARANAAVVLGMNPDPKQISDLERPWANEKDAAVKLTLAYALARHGKRELIGDLTKALLSCPGGVCEEAITLLQWLPNDLTTNLDPAMFATLGSDARQRLAVRLSALRILGDIGRKKSLSPQAREGLLAIAQETNRDLSLAASEAIAKDSGFSRELVLAALAKPSPAHGALLKRLARVATVAELPVLRQHMPRFAEMAGDESDALLEAAARLPGVHAEAQMVNWFDAHPALRRRIAFRLLVRPNLQRATEEHLASATDRDVHLLVSVIRSTPDARALLQAELRAGEPAQRLFAIFLAGLVRDPGIKPELWSLVNFRDDKFYPDDARIRHAAMSSLLWIALDEVVAARGAQGAGQPPNRAE